MPPSLDDRDAIVAARKFMQKWNAFQTNTTKNGHLPTLGRHLTGLQLSLAKHEAGSYAQVQSDLTRAGAPNIAFSDVLEQLDAIHTELLNAEDPTAVGFDSHHLGPQFLPILQHTGITAIAVGLTTTNPTNEVNRRQNGTTEPEGMKYMWASLDKLGGLAFRAWRGRRVPTAHVSFMPGINPDSLLTELRARRSSCEVRLCFHHTGSTNN
jgi:hypothetical protein